MRPTLVAFVLVLGCVDQAAPPSSPANVEVDQAAPPASPAKAEDTGEIRGRVRDPDGNPVSGAVLSVPKGARTTTDDYGHYLLVVPTGAYQVTVAAPTYELMKQAVEVDAGMVHIRDWDLVRTAAQPTN